jgi:hypothetical protein
MQGVDDLGSTSKTLNYVFGGDYQSWEWLNAHLGSRGRVATLDNRLYYFNNPRALFYLDGLEAEPLLRLHGASEIVAFLKHQHVRYVFSPAWATQSGDAQQPVVRDLPLSKLLGGPHFPLVAMFAVGGYNQPDEIFAVGRSHHGSHRAALPPVLYGGPREGSPTLPLNHQTVQIAPNDSTPRLFVTTTAEDQLLTFQYKQSTDGSFELNKYDSSSNDWLDGIFQSTPHWARAWSTAVVPLFGLQRFHILDLGIYGTNSSLFLRSIRVETVRRPLFENNGAYSLGSGKTVVAAKSTAARLFLPRTTRPETLTVLYRTSGDETITFNRFDPVTGHWTYDVFSFNAIRSPSWQRVTIPTGDSPNALTQLGVYAPKYGIAFKDAEVSPLSAPVVEGGSPSKGTPNNAGSGTSLNVAIPATQSMAVTLTITSTRPGTINVVNASGVPSAPAIDIPMYFSGPSTRELSLPSVPVPGGIETFDLSSANAFSVSAHSAVDSSSILTDDSDGTVWPTGTVPALFQPNRVDSRIFLLSASDQKLVFSFEYRTGAESSLAFNREIGTSWSDVINLSATSGIWKRASFQVMVTKGYTELGVFTPNSVAEVRNLSVSTTR